jgi:hypothetical protein
MKIIFFNHYHRGDLFTHKEFARDIKRQLPDFEFEYWHYNHPKVNADLLIPVTNAPQQLGDRELFYKTEDGQILFVNTWIGVHSDAMTKWEGINLGSLYESWSTIYAGINTILGTALQISPNKFDYMPWVDYTIFNVEPGDKWLATYSGRKRVLICNGVAMSGQSFNWEMDDIINDLAHEYPSIDIICTKKFKTDKVNIFFTDDITEATEEWHIKPFWVDLAQNTCDLNEISYLSTFCDVIVGKNSGPFVFCECKDNYLDDTKHIISFSTSSGGSMSHNIAEMKCAYTMVTDHSPEIVKSILNKAFKEIYE